jgi:hypothetical protein
MENASPMTNPQHHADTLIGPGQWPNVSMDYQYTGAAGAPVLAISLALNPAPYALAEGMAAPAAIEDSALFELARVQLNDSTVSLRNTLTGGHIQALDEANRAALVQFVTDCAAYVNAAAEGAPPANAPTGRLSLDVPQTSVVQDILRLRLSLRLSRQAAPGLEPAIESVQAEIFPQTTLTAFAQSFETAFANIRVGTGQDHSVWAVRFSIGASGQGLAFTLGAQPVFFAPKPLAKAPVSGEVVLPSYTTGSGLGAGPRMNFAGIDPNLWLAQALRSIDDFLSPAYAAPAAHLGTSGDADGVVARIRTQKSVIATAAGNTVTPIFAGDAQNALVAAAARTALEQSALQLLANAAAVTAVAVLPVSNATTNTPGGAVLYGQPTGNTPGDYVLSAGNIPLHATGAATDSTLAFLFTSTTPRRQTSVPLTLRYQLTHLLYDGAEIALVTGPLEYESNSTAVDFPVPLRALPQPPTALAQTATASADATTAATLPNWDYAFTTSTDWAAQDRLLATVAFNTSVPQRNAAPHPADALFQALAVITALTPVIFADFDTWLRKIDSATKITDAAYINAKAAVGAFNTLVTNVANAYTSWANPAPAPAATPPPMALAFTVTLINVAGVAVTLVTSTGDAPKIVPVVQLDPDVYTPVPFTPPQPPPNLIAAYQYAAADKSLLTYDTALRINERRITFQNLNGLAYQQAEAKIEIRRNQDLTSGHNQLTADDFVFATSPLAFTAPAVPLIIRASFDLSTSATSPVPLANYLSAFFAALLGTNDPQSVTAQIRSSASYAIADIAGAPRASLPVNLMPPTPPTPAAISGLADAVSIWLTQHGQHLAGRDAQLDFEITLYSPLPGHSQPLLQIENAFLTLDRLP